MKKKGSSLIVFAVVAVLVILFGILSIHIIPTGYVGVKSTMGQIDENPMNPGTHFTFPLIQGVRRVCTKQADQQYSDKIWSETVNRTAVYFEGTIITTSISADRATWLVANVADYDNPVTPGMVQSAIKSASKQFDDTDVTNRGLIEPAAQTALQKAVDEKYGEGTITINRVVITNADFDEAYQKAIADKQEAILKAEQQEIINARNIKEAEANKTVKITNAQAEAEAKKIEAQGQADANALLEKSITPNILEDKKLDKWDGVLPKVVNGENGGIMIDLTGAEASETSKESNKK